MRELLARAERVAESKSTVLLTGANGYLGRFLCLDWLQRLAETGGRLICLARGADPIAARHRIEAAIDSGDAELSAHYHRYTTDFYLLALLVARAADDPAADAFEDAARRLSYYLRTIAGSDGMLPLTGDDDGGQCFPFSGRAAADASSTLSVAAVALHDATLAAGPPAEEAVWLCGPSARVPRADAAWPSAARAHRRRR